MILSDWSSCPSCKLPCNYTEMKRQLEFEPVCPICESAVNAMSITIAADPESEFKALSELMKDSGPTEED
jgi:hypothetical protein